MKKFKLVSHCIAMVLCLAGIVICLVWSGLVNKSGYYSSYDNVSYEYYGGDAYTGIQNAAVSTRDNVIGAGSTVRNILEDIGMGVLIAGAIAFAIVFLKYLGAFISDIVEIRIDKKNAVEQSK